MDGGGILIFILFLAIVIAAAIYGALAAKKRRKELSVVGARLGLSCNPEDDRALAAGFSFLDQLAQASNRYTFDMLSGRYREDEVLPFDYHYETHSTASTGNRQTHLHCFWPLTSNWPPMHRIIFLAQMAGCA